MVPEGRLHMRPFQFHLKEHWRYHPSLDSLLPWTETISAHLDWWQNPTNMMRGADLHPKDHSIQQFTDASNEGWGVHLDQGSTKGLWSDYLRLPSNSCPSQSNPKNQAMPLPDHRNSPRLAIDALVLGPSAALNRDPTSTTCAKNSSQTVPQLCVSQQSTTSQPPHLVSRSGQLQE